MQMTPILNNGKFVAVFIHFSKEPWKPKPTFRLPPITIHQKSFLTDTSSKSNQTREFRGHPVSVKIQHSVVANSCMHIIGGSARLEGSNPHEPACLQSVSHLSDAVGTRRLSATPLLRVPRGRTKSGQQEFAIAMLLVFSLPLKT
jgi:hypothetical protein